MTLSTPAPSTRLILSADTSSEHLMKGIDFLALSRNELLDVFHGGAEDAHAEVRALLPAVRAALDPVGLTPYPFMNALERRSYYQGARAVVKLLHADPVPVETAKTLRQRAHDAEVALAQARRRATVAESALAQARSRITALEVEYRRGPRQEIRDLKYMLLQALAGTHPQQVAEHAERTNRWRRTLHPRPRLWVGHAPSGTTVPARKSA